MPAAITVAPIQLPADYWRHVGLPQGYRRNHQAAQPQGDTAAGAREEAAEELSHGPALSSAGYDGRPAALVHGDDYR